MVQLWAQWEACQEVSKLQAEVQLLPEEKLELMQVQAQAQVLLNSNLIHSLEWEAWVEWADFKAWIQL